MLGDEEVLWVIEVREQSVLDPVNDTGLQVYQKRARDVVLIIRLVEKDVLPIVALGSELLELTLWVDPMLLAQTLPELISNYVSNMSRSSNHLLWFPHYPTCSVMISLGIFI